jgi:hypothetical protein
MLLQNLPDTTARSGQWVPFWQVLWALYGYELVRLQAMTSWFLLAVPERFGPTNFSPKTTSTIMLQRLTRLIVLALGGCRAHNTQTVMDAIVTARCSKGIGEDQTEVGMTGGNANRRSTQ